MILRGTSCFFAKLTGISSALKYPILYLHLWLWGSFLAVLILNCSASDIP
jgi:hypothetical protein